MEALQLSPALYPAIPMIASVIVHEINSDINPILPTEQDIKAMKPYLRQVARVIGRFNHNWTDKFDRYIERKGGKIVEDTGKKIYESVRAIGKIPNPQMQFVAEIARLYDQLATPQYETNEGLFGEHTEEVPIEKRIKNIFYGLYEIRNGRPQFYMSEADFPLLYRVLPLVKFPSEQLMEDIDTIGITGAEMMQGIEAFLRREGIRGVKNAPRPRELDLFNPNTWMRTLAEWFASEKLQRVQDSLPEILSLARDILPQNGPQLETAVITVAKNIISLKKQGKSDSEIAEAMSKK